MKKYLIIMTSSFVLEMASTMYISTVSHKSIYMIFWAFIGSWISLPFAGYMVESKDWNERVKLAAALSTGYSLGATVIYFL
jgi:membrane protein DedA with SNARE-associated domain